MKRTVQLAARLDDDWGQRPEPLARRQLPEAAAVDPASRREVEQKLLATKVVLCSCEPGAEQHHAEEAHDEREEKLQLADQIRCRQLHHLVQGDGADANRGLTALEICADTTTESKYSARKIQNAYTSTRCD